MKKTYLLLTLVLTSSISLISCNSKSEEKEDNTKIEESISDSKDNKPKIEKEEKKEEKLPEVSQTITEFPWDGENEFKEAQLKNDTDVLIAGFCTVLEKSTEAERTNIGLAAKSVTGIVIEPGEVFSQNQAIGPYTEDKGYKEGSGYVGNKIVKSMGGGVCKVASTLYNTAIASDLDIVERYNHSMPVPYVPYGQDAAVAFGSKDLKFKNNTDHPILIWAKMIDNRIYMGFYGKEKGPEVKWEHKTINKTEAPTEYKINPELEDGEENVLVEGMHGELVESKVIIKDKDGNEEIKDLGKSSYLPMTHLIEKNK